MNTPITLSVLLLDDTAGAAADNNGACDALFYDAVSALLDELHWAMPVWPETAEAVAEMLGWDAPAYRPEKGATVSPLFGEVPEFLRGRQNGGSR